MDKWKHDFEKMFMEQNGNFDDNFLAYVNSINEQWDHNLEQPEGIPSNNVSGDILNTPITRDEVCNAIVKCKNGTAVGIDNIPNEVHVLSQPHLHDLIHKLFQMCFEHNMVPTVWLKSIIHPILKKGKDARVPASYRSISLMSTVVMFIDVHNFLHDFTISSTILQFPPPFYNFLHSFTISSTILQFPPLCYNLLCKIVEQIVKSWSKL